jgi:hypothetical protein
MDSIGTKSALEIEMLRLEVEALKKPDPAFRIKLTEQWQAILVTIIVALLASMYKRGGVNNS